ncbi:MAG TPA: hypothetical protein VM847_01640 [Tahibacter sp.]|nr:hypothetical protein [Tahibacter sp.]
MPPTASAPPRAAVLVHGPTATTAWWQALLAQLPDGLALGATFATDLPATATPLAVAGTSPADLLAAAAAQWPGRRVILLRSDAQLPPYWAGRLLAALDEPGVVAASPLDDASAAWHPCPGASAAVARIDALCQAYGRGLLLDSGDVSPLLSAWAAPTETDLDLLRRFGVSVLGRCVRLDRLYVAAARPPRLSADALALSRLGELRGQLAAALTDADWQPAWFGRDGRPVVLHVLHGWGGGAERFVRDLAASDTAHTHLVLRAFGDFPRRRYGEVLELHDGSLHGPALRRLPLTATIADTALHHHDWQGFFGEILAQYAVDAVMISSLIGHSG